MIYNSINLWHDGSFIYFYLYIYIFLSNFFISLIRIRKIYKIQIEILLILKNLKFEIDIFISKFNVPGKKRLRSNSNNI